jgi:hypothetical protein
VRYVIVADFWANDFAGGAGKHSGGAELSDEILYSALSERGESVVKVKSSQVTHDLLDEEENSIFILSNFFQLNTFLLERIQELKYLLYCHDYKFVEHMQPQLHEGFRVPEEQLINKDLFKKAIAVICQSSLQQKIHIDNLKIDNTINFSGNLWDEEVLSLMEQLKDSEKQNTYSVVKSPYHEKGVVESIKFCIDNRLDYDLIGHKDYKTFLRQLSCNKGLVFLNNLPETCGRIAVEAKMMGVQVHTTELLGASHEPWFNLQGTELIEVMRNKHDEIHNIITTLNYD